MKKVLLEWLHIQPGVSYESIKKQAILTLGQEGLKDKEVNSHRSEHLESIKSNNNIGSLNENAEDLEEKA